MNGTNALIAIFAALLLFTIIGGHVEPHRLALLAISTAVLGLCIFSFRRAAETAEILRAGVVAAFKEFEDDEFKIDLARFGRHTRAFVIFLSMAILLYWFGIRTYVSVILGLVGATLVFCEFVLNFEVLGHLCSSPSASFSDRGATQVVSVYRMLSLAHMAAVTTAITLLLLR